MAFCHLHVHSQYSLLDGAIPVKKLPKAVAALGQAHVALTDHCNLYGAVPFHQGCREAGVHAVIGAGLWVQPEGVDYVDPDRERGGYHLVFLVEDQRGYRNLCKLITHAIFDGMYYKPRVDLALLRRHREGLIALTSGLRGPVRGPLLPGPRRDPGLARARLEGLLDVLGPDHLFLELQDVGFDGEAEANAAALALAEELGVLPVATNMVHYLEAEHATRLEVLHAIGFGQSLNDGGRPRGLTDQLYLKSEEEMRELFSPAGLDHAVGRTVELAERCRFDFDYKTAHFPASTPPDPAPDGKAVNQPDTAANWAFFYRAFPPPQDFGLPTPEEGVPAHPLGAGTLNGYFRWFCQKGLELRLRRVPAELHAAYEERLEAEHAIITAMDFPAYFLIVAEFINWAKDNGIPVGPGRGSAAGSLAAYAMRITDIDPIRFDLLFERFLNPERVSMPDVDVDFCQDRREEVIEHTRHKYGDELVAQIITYGKLQARLAIRDVARVCDLTFQDADRIAKLVPEELGITLEDAMKEEGLQRLLNADPKARRVYDLARSVEGLTRQTGVHAAGVVVADRPLVELCPLYRDGAGGGPVVQFDMKSAESIGLIKFDFLGLKTLDQIRDAVALIARNTGTHVDMAAIPEDDAASYELLQRGDALGVFQVESSGMRELLTRLRPSNLEDLVALVALYRPGPLSAGMVDDFIDRKHGRKQVEYPLPQLEPILRNTYGVVVYQEQVMQIAQVLASYSLGEADLLRRAMGKKKPEEMAQQKARFMSGAAQNAVDVKKAEGIFDLLAMFAAYGFNKSHSAAYGYVSYQTAWLKANHRAEYMAALLSIEAGNTDKVIAYISDCKRAGLRVCPPDVNVSVKGFDVPSNDRRSIRFGLEAVKNVGASAVEAILEARREAGGRFRDLMDCLERLDYGRVNRRVLEHLIKAGAFDWTRATRATLLDGLDVAIGAAQREQVDRRSGQVSLFGALGSGPRAVGVALPELPEWPLSRKLALERDALGFFLSGHPVEAYVPEVERAGGVRLDILHRVENGKDVVVAGMATAQRQVRTKRGDKMGFVTLDDGRGTLECVFFADPWASSRRALATDAPILVRGTLEKKGEECKLLAESVEVLSDLRERATRRVRIRLLPEDLDRARLRALVDLLREHKGSCSIRVHVAQADRSEVVLKVDERLAVAPVDGLVEGVGAIFRRNDLVTFE